MITEQICEGLAGIRAIKPRDSTEARRPSPNDVELDLIFNNIEHYHCKNQSRRIFEKSLLALLLKTGIRIDEAYNIYLEDINLQEQTLFIRKAKGGKQRQIGLTLSACLILRTYMEKRGFTDEKIRLFVKEDGNPYSNSKALSKVIIKACKRVGLNYSPHALRRKFSQDMVFKHNVALPIVAQAMGHNPGDIKTLMTSYCLVPQNQSVEVLKNLE